MLAQCLIDWLWLLPGLVGLAFLALGSAVAAGGAEHSRAARQACGALGAGSLAARPRGCG